MTGGTGLGHAHVWRPAPGARRTLLLLHGTGGDERDLLPLARAVDPHASVLSPRGNVLEEGAPRFFRRLAPGVLDLEDLERRTHELADFVVAASKTYGFAITSVAALGFSNGANIGASLLFRRPEVLREAVLVRAMLPYLPGEPPALGGHRALLLAGRLDPYSAPDQTEPLAAVLRSGGARVEVHYANAGHDLTPTDVAMAWTWLASE